MSRTYSQKRVLIKRTIPLCRFGCKDTTNFTNMQRDGQFNNGKERKKRAGLASPRQGHFAEKKILNDES